MTDDGELLLGDARRLLQREKRPSSPWRAELSGTRARRGFEEVVGGSLLRRSR